MKPIFFTLLLLGALWSASAHAQSHLVPAAEQKISQDEPFGHYEFSLACHPGSADDLMVSAIAVTQPQQCRVYNSRDGGKNWESHLLSTESSGDPIVAWGERGQAYFAYLSSANGRRIRFFASRAGGQNWRDSVWADQNDDKVAGDHPMMAVDTTQSQFRGTIYIAAQYDDGTIRVSTSRDEGQTWRQTIAVKDWQKGFVHNLLVLKDGTLLVPLETQNNIKVAGERYAGSESGHFFVVSRDGGQTFSEPVKVIDQINGVGGAGGASNAVWARGLWKKDGEIGERIYAAICDTRDGNGRIRWRHSDDGGNSWSTLDVATPNLAPDHAQGAFNITTNPRGDVGIFWLDSTQPNFFDAYFAASNDGGATVSAPLRLSSQTSRERDSPRYPGGDYLLADAARDGTFWLLWPDGREENYQIWARAVRVETPLK